MNQARRVLLAVGLPVALLALWWVASADSQSFYLPPLREILQTFASTWLGAVVNGPNGAENFEDLGIPDGARVCPVDGRNRYAAFDRPDARFLDDVRAWPSVEPAIDFTSTGMLAFALATAR